MAALQFGMIGAGFWARYQLAAWRQVGGANCIAVCDNNFERARRLADEFAIPGVYEDVNALFSTEPIDFADIVTSPETHANLVQLASQYRFPIICQKPMATSLADAERMEATCRKAGVPLLIHENWRWQRPIRELKAVLDAGTLGTPFRAHLAFRTGFPILKNQPFLGELEEYILSDMGTHLLDVARFLFGEADRLYCQFHRVHPQIKGEDAATVMLWMGGKTVVCEMAEAETPLEHDRGDTLAFIEGDRGSAELSADCWLRVTTANGTLVRRVAPPNYAWAHPDYALFQSAMVPCITNLLGALRGEIPAETTAEDNLRTLRLVYAAYDSGRNGKVVELA